MYALFISDLHLNAHNELLTDTFLSFLQEEAKKADCLYILGDLFEAWIGDDEQSAFTEKIAQALHQLGETVPIYFMHGNRDFLIGKAWAKLAAIELLEDPTIISLGAHRTLLTHGDLLCTQDIHYQRFRIKVRNTDWQKRFLNLPLWLRRTLAKFTRWKSKRYTQRTHLTIQDVTHTTVIEWFKRYQVDTIIHGHTHKPNIHTLNIDNKTYQRIVLGAWEDKPFILRYSEKAILPFELISL